MRAKFSNGPKATAAFDHLIAADFAAKGGDFGCRTVDVKQKFRVFMDVAADRDQFVLVLADAVERGVGHDGVLAGAIGTESPSLSRPPACVQPAR